MPKPRSTWPSALIERATSTLADAQRCWTAASRASAQRPPAPRWSSASSWRATSPKATPRAGRAHRRQRQGLRGALCAGRAAGYAGDFNAAFDQLLEVVLRDKAEWREKARVQLVEWFDVCGDAEAVSRGRRYLGMYLN
jgi:thioredoxin-like negative regulator of GroEL